MPHPPGTEPIAATTCEQEVVAGYVESVSTQVNSTDVGAAERYRAALRETGETGWSEFDLTGYDRTQIPVRAVVWDAADGSDAHGVGYGLTSSAASIGAWGEVAERVLMRDAVAALPTVRGSHAELVAVYGEDGVADPLGLVLDAGCGYTAQRPLTWVPAQRWRTGEQVLVPRDFVLSAPQSDTDGLMTPVTNGLGAGDAVERAVAHGLLELIQRDGDNLRFRAFDRGAVIDLDGASPEVRQIRDVLCEVGIEPIVKLASTEFACVVYCVGRDEDERTSPMALSAIGEAAHPDREVAVAKAMLEYASSRARRTFAFGPFAEVRRRHPAYAAAELDRPLGEQEPRALAAMREWSGWSGSQLRAALEPLLRETTSVAWDDLPTSSAGEPGELLSELLPRVGDVLFVRGQAGDMHAAKVLCPGLEVETVSYLRAGTRAVEELFALGAGLVGRGIPTSPAQLPVHLPAHAAQRLGPVWIDRDAMDAQVGRLYPLYREPRRHAIERTAS